jgi:TrmH family RNA methyltransferase
MAKENITIPRFGQAESLNAAVATGIVLSHIV